MPGAAQEAAKDEDRPAIVAGVPRYWPPQYRLDAAGHPTGFAIDIMEEVAKRAGVEVTYRVFENFPEVMEAAYAGEIDVVPNVGLTAGRTEDFAFTAPVETFVVSIFVRHDTLDIESIDDLAGHSVAVVEFNLGARLIEQRRDVDGVVFRDVEAALFALLSGQVDAFIYPEPVARNLVRKIGLESRIETVGPPLQEVKRAILIANPDPRLQAALNAGVDELLGTPAYQAIYVKWYGKPSPYWSATRILLVGAALFALLALAMTAWRFYSILQLNRKLRRSIEERDLAEDAQRKSEAQFRRYFELGLIGMAIVAPDRRWLVVNKRLREMLGRTEAEFRHKTWDELTETSDLAGSRARFERIERGESESFLADQRFLAKDGRTVYASVSVACLRSPEGAVDSFLAAIQDVTERKMTEDALRDSEAVLANAQRIARMGSWDLDLPLRQLQWSDELYRLLGRPPRSFPPSSEIFLEAVHPDDREQRRDAARRAKRSGETVGADYRLVTADGQQRRIHEEIRFFFDSSGKAVRGAGVAQDVTDQALLEEQLRQAQKMEAVGQLTGGIAHDFNNLLAVIIGNLELIESGLAPGDPLYDQIEPMLRAGARGAELTQRLLAFSRKQALQPKPTDMNRLVVDVTDMLRRTLGESIEIETVLAAGLWPTLVDHSQLENALLNLAVNARDAMPAGGKLTIETANVRLDEAYAAAQPELTPGQYVLLAVTDTGTGMPADVLQHVFEPFFTTKRLGKGSGLGLSMIYGFVKQSGGHVSIYSELGQGTTAKIYLPRARTADTAASAAPRDDTREPRGRSESILVVEDDPDVRSLAVAMLETLGYQVLEAADGPEAMSLLADEEHRIDLLFSDVVLPGGLGGRELAEQAVHERPELRVLFMSGYTENAIVHHGRLDPEMALLGKPFRRAALARKIREVLDRD